MTKSLLTVAAAVVLAGLASTAQAQQPPAPPAPPAPPPPPVQTGPETTTRPTFELSVGYQWLTAGAFCLEEVDEETCTNDDATNFPVGVAVDAVRNWGAFGLIGEAGWSHYVEDDIGGLPGSRRTDDVFHIGAGMRFTFRPGRVWPYVQVIGGAAVLRFDADLVTSDFEDTRTRPFVQGGGGVTFVVGDGWGLFVAGDYRRLFLDEDEDFDTGRNDVRGLFGVRMILD